MHTHLHTATHVLAYFDRMLLTGGDVRTSGPCWPSSPSSPRNPDEKADPPPPSTTPIKAEIFLRKIRLRAAQSLLAEQSP